MICLLKKCMLSKYIDLVVLLSVSEGSQTPVKYFWELIGDRGGNSNKEVFCHLTNRGMVCK